MESAAPAKDRAPACHSNAAVVASVLEIVTPLVLDERNVPNELPPS
jgi:hypothetical protein